MKIKVSSEIIFDSEEFYSEFTKEELKNLTFEEFADGISLYIDESPFDFFEKMKFEEIKE